MVGTSLPLLCPPYDRPDVHAHADDFIADSAERIEKLCEKYFRKGRKPPYRNGLIDSSIIADRDHSFKDALCLKLILSDF